MRWGVMSLAVAGVLCWSSVAVQAAFVVKVCERTHLLPRGVVTVKETHQYVLGRSFTCPEPEVLSALPAARVLAPVPEAMSSLLKTVRSLPVLLPAQRSVSSATAISTAGSVGQNHGAGADIHRKTVRFGSGSSLGRLHEEGK